jgi:hypothetical protein
MFKGCRFHRRVVRRGLVLLGLSATLSIAPLAAYASAGDHTVSQGRELSGKLAVAPTLSPYVQKLATWKLKLAQEYAAAQASGQWATYNRDLLGFNSLYPNISTSLSGGRTQPLCAGACYSSNSVYLTQQPQTTSYYCGPASASEVLGHWGIGGSDQGSMASLMSTTSGGTNWSMSSSNENSTLGVYRSGYPMPDATNYRRGTIFYYPVAVPFYPGSADYTNYQNNMAWDIDYGYPVIGDAEENYNGPHLAGHPNFTWTIYHWFAIYGYSSSGANTSYADSVYNATAVSWHQYVTAAYSTLTSHKIVDIVGDRGYDW